MEEDAISIFKMVLSVPDFNKALEGITHEKVAVVIDEALDALHHGPESTEKDALLMFELHTDALMVIAVLMQWLLSYVCKRLMQLVPPEAIPVHCSGIPTVYIKNYLVFQEHFSLKKLIEHQRFQLQGNDWSVSVIIIDKSLCHELNLLYYCLSIHTGTSQCARQSFYALHALHRSSISFQLIIQLLLLLLPLRLWRILSECTYIPI